MAATHTVSRRHSTAELQVMTAENEGEQSAAVLSSSSLEVHPLPGLIPGEAVLTNAEVRDQLSGLYYFDNFISEEEQDALVALIDSQPFCEVRCSRQLPGLDGTLRICILDSPACVLRILRLI